jgi:hypothetical protein
LKVRSTLARLGISTTSISDIFLGSSSKTASLGSYGLLSNPAMSHDLNQSVLSGRLFRQYQDGRLIACESPRSDGICFGPLNAQIIAFGNLDAVAAIVNSHFKRQPNGNLDSVLVRLIRSAGNEPVRGAMKSQKFSDWLGFLMGPQPQFDLPVIDSQLIAFGYSAHLESTTRLRSTLHLEFQSELGAMTITHLLRGFVSAISISTPVRFRAFELQSISRRKNDVGMEVLFPF